jgi:hypothetical protein
MNRRTHTYVFFLLVSVVGAFVTALAFIVVIQLSLPPTDLAYGHSIFSIISDPFVLVIAGSVAFASGLAASPLLYFCLQRRRLSVTLPIIFGSVLITIALMTPLSKLLGLFGSYAALVISCIVCAKSKSLNEVDDKQ